jgi:integrase
MKLSAVEVRRLALEPGKSETINFDADVAGFGLRIRDTGSRTFVYQYKLGNEQRRLTIGSASAIDVGAARETAKDLYAKVRLGQDPAGEKARAKIAASETFKVLVDRYLEHKRRELGSESYDNVEFHLLTHAKPLHGLQVEKIARRDVAACIGAIVPDKRFKTDGAVTRNRVRASLSAFFAWTIGQGLTENNPVIGVGRSKEKARDRVLSMDELAVVWNALEEDDYGAIMRLLMLTGQRAASELRSAAFLLPPERTKNRREHLVPLSSAAQEVIGRQEQRFDRDGAPRDLTFGYRGGPFGAWSDGKEALDKRIIEKHGAPLPHWRAHDLRRRFATHAAEIGIQPHIIEAILNHVSGHKSGVVGVYNRALYEPEKRTGLNTWAAHLLAHIEGRESNVTPIRRGA